MEIRLVNFGWLKKIKIEGCNHMNENIDKGIMEKVSIVVWLWFHIFLCWPSTSLQTWFGVWFIAYVHVCFYIYGWIHSGGLDVTILWCPLDRVGSFDKLGHFIYDKFVYLTMSTDTTLLLRTYVRATIKS